MQRLKIVETVTDEEDSTIEGRKGQVALGLAISQLAKDC